MLDKYYPLTLLTSLKKEILEIPKLEIPKGKGIKIEFIERPRLELDTEDADIKFLKEKIFTPSARYRWDEMIKRATGEELTAKYFVEEFVK